MSDEIILTVDGQVERPLRLTFSDLANLPEPAQFRFLGSTTRRDDIVGTMLERWNTEELQELDPLETALEAADGSSGDPVPVRLHSRITEVGTLELSCQSTRDPRRWKLEFNVREGNEE